jgi:putative inorganic carbon (hco3(-)) transporter
MNNDVLTQIRGRADAQSLIVPVCLSIICALGIVFAFELRLAFQIALAAGFIGTVIFFICPNKRILLVVAWILLHPLSLEKIFIAGRPLLPGFFPPAVILSGSDIALYALLITLLLEAAYTGEKAWFWPAALTPMAIFTLWAIIVFFVRGASMISALATVHTLKMLLFVLILSSAIRTREEFIMTVVAIALAVGIQDILVGLAYATGKIVAASAKLKVSLMTFSGGEGEQYIRATGTLGHVNQQASFLTFYVLPLLGLLSVKNKIWKAFGIAVISTALVAVILTFSRSAWLSYALAILAIVAYMGMRLPFSRRQWVAFSVTVAVFLSILLVYQRPIMNRILHGDEGATDSRKRAMNLALDLIVANPLLGVGPGNFASASLQMYPHSRLDVVWLKPDDLHRKWMYRYGRLEIATVETADNQVYVVPLPVHNKYLLVLSELGVVGLFLFIWFQWRIFQHIRIALKAEDKFLFWSALGIMGAFFASQSYMNLDLFADDKSMATLLIIPVLALSLSRIVQAVPEGEAR